MFITFEGIDGSGKSTQINLLADYIRSLNLDVVILREPGGTALSEAIRELLLNSLHHVNPLTELLLFEAARSELVEKIIKPSLEAGKVVICDRFFDSTTAYQGYGRGLDLNEINLLNKLASGNLAPDLTFYLDIDYNIAVERSNDRKPDKIENSGDHFFEKVISGFRKIAEENKERFIVIDARGHLTETHELKIGRAHV